MIGTMRGKSRRRAQKREPAAGGSGRRAGLSVPGVRHEECSGRARYSAIKQGAESVNAGGIAGFMLVPIRSGRALFLSFAMMEDEEHVGHQSDP